MKQLLMVLFLMSTLSTVAKATEDKPVSEIVLQSFKKSFVEAKEVSWTTAEEFYRASFVYNDQHITAYYECSGNLIALTKNILSSKLPVMLQSNLKETFSDYWINSIVEYSTEAEITYYVVIENRDQKIMLKSSQNNWITERKITK